MYRVAKKTTKRTQGHCLKCKHCKELYEFSGGGQSLNALPRTVV